MLRRAALRLRAPAARSAPALRASAPSSTFASDSSGGIDWNQDKDMSDLPPLSAQQQATARARDVAIRTEHLRLKTDVTLTLTRTRTRTRTPTLGRKPKPEPNLAHPNPKHPTAAP
mmetsp:Transcript_11440/g.34749  ORF Transcript_11440/g.34749 Transcript_11440/m.34749 type:complete len:116 (-) Transcript_11440:244-591(-)